MRQNTISVRRENKTLENFKSFISEEKHENYRVVVISNELGDKAITAKRMEEEANKLEYVRVGLRYVFKILTTTDISFYAVITKHLFFPQ